MGSPRRKISVLYKYFISYIAIFAIPLIILGVSFYRNSVIEMENQVKRYTFDKVVRMRETLDSMILDTKKVALKISLDERIKPYVVNLNDYHSRSAIDQLNKYWDKNYVSNMFVYFKNDDYVYTLGGKVSFDTLYNSVLGASYDSGESFKEELQRINAPAMMRIDTMISGIPRNEGLMCLYPLPLGRSNYYGVVGIVIDRQIIEKMASEVLGDLKGALILYNSDMDSIFNFGDEEVIPLAKEIGPQAFPGNTLDEIQNMEIQGRRLSIIDVASENMDFRIFLAIFPESYLSRVIVMKRQLVLMIGIVIVVGMLLSFVFSLTNYRPIKNLFNMIKAYFPVENGESDEGDLRWERGFAISNELENIERIVKGIAIRNSSLVEQLSHHQSFVREQILLMLVKGKLSNEQKINELLSLYKIDFPYNYFFVAVVSIKKEKDYSITTSELNLYINSIIENKIKNKRVYCIDTVQGDFVLLFNTSYENCSKIVIENMMKDIQVFFRNHLGVRVNVGIGNVYEGINFISRSFIEALNAIDYNLLIGYENIIFYDEIISSSKKAYWYPAEEQMRFVQCLKQGNTYVIKDIIKEIIGKIKKKQLSIGLTRAICFGMINAVVEVLNELDIKNFDDDIEELAQFGSLEDLEEKIEKLAYRICEYVNSRKESHNEALKIAVIEYIHENYTNKMLSLEMVAEKLNISPKYLSRFFKEQIGFNFVDYVRELRINYAKKLLRETSSSIKDIVDRIGYSDVASFTRTFKKLEGITPGEYRKMMANV